MDLSRRNFIVGGISLAGAAAASPLISGCTNANQTTKSGLETRNFESSGTGSFNKGLQNTYTANVATKLIVLSNSNGMEVCITNFGARIVSIMVKDKNGDFKDVVLGFGNIADYADYDGKNNIFGAEAGRTIGRISNAKFTLDGKEYTLDKNYKGKHNLHGGKYGWHYQTWKILGQSNNSVDLQIVSPDNDSGFPGELTYNLNYTLSDDNSLIISGKANTSKRTPLNVANHAYFNLEGNPANDIYNDQVQIFAKKISYLKEDIIPDGTIRDIPQNDELDFYTAPKTISKNIDLNSGIWKYCGGYDFPYVLEGNHAVNASIYNPKSGIKLEVITDRPVMNFYDSRDLTGKLIGKNNIAYKPYCALCLEAQTFCDAVNNDGLSNTIINPEQTFTTTTIYKFSVK